MEECTVLDGRENSVLMGLFSLPTHITRPEKRIQILSSQFELRGIFAAPDDELPLNKTTKTPSIIIVVTAVFHENNKYYTQVFLDECLYKLRIIQECYIMIELTFLKKLKMY